MKCADIPDDVFMAAVAVTPPRTLGCCWRNRRDVQATLEEVLETELPEKLFLAKARKLGENRKLEGCTRCTCRGDYHLPRECRIYRCCYTSEMDWAKFRWYDPSWEADVRPGDGQVLEEAVMEAVRRLAGR